MQTDDMCMGEDPVDPTVTNAALVSLLEHQPTALVAAIDDGGFFVPPPASLPVGRHRVAQARSALDLVQGSHREVVIEAWHQVKACGAARATVALAGDGGGHAALHFFDVRAAHGTFVGVMVAIDVDPDRLDRVAEIPASSPRLVRTRKDELAVLLYADHDLTAMLGWENSEFVGRRSLEFIHPDDHDQAISAWMEVLGKPGSTCRARLRHQHRDGHWVWLEIANRNLLDQPDGYVECEMFDISEEMNAQEAVRASEQLLRRLAGALPVGVVQFDIERRILYANERLREILGAGPDTSEHEMLAAVVDPSALEGAIESVLVGEDVDVDVRIDRINGSGRALCTLALRALTSPEGVVTGAVGCLTDVTDAARMRAELEHRATFDGLTGCINRAAAMHTLDHALSESAGDTAVIFIDLDGFKAVNDHHGHAVGDTMLVAVSARLREALRAGDVVGRIGGDEFLVICSDVACADAALALGERVAVGLAEELAVDGAIVVPQASIGVAWAAGRPIDADSLIAEADAAMYASKNEGGGRPVLAGTPSDHPVADRTPTGDLGTALRQAVARRELELH